MSGSAPTVTAATKVPFGRKKTTLPGSVLGLASTATATRSRLASTLFGPAPQGLRSMRVRSRGAAGLDASTTSSELPVLLVTKRRPAAYAAVSPDVPPVSPVA